MLAVGKTYLLSNEADVVLLWSLTVLLAEMVMLFNCRLSGIYMERTIHAPILVCYTRITEWLDI